MKRAEILIVEDESIVAMEIQQRLTDSGYGVCAVVASGEEAIEKCGELRPNLVLMDIHLKGDMDGIEAAQHVRDRFDIPVVFLTAHAEEGTLQRAKISEPFGYVIKPFQEEALYTTIEIALYKHKVAKRVRDSERRLATTLRSIDDAVITTDKACRVTMINPVAEKLTGWHADQAVGRNLSEVFQVIDEITRGNVPHPVVEILEGEPAVTTDHPVLVGRDGVQRPVEQSAAPMSDEDGNIIGAVLVFRDISERRRREAEKEGLQAQLFQAQKMDAIGTLAGGVAHDFNNLLTTIQGNAELAMLKIDQGVPIDGDLQEIHGAAERAANLTQQLLMFSRRQPMRFVRLSISETVRGVLSMARRLIREDIAMNLDLEPDLWSVLADKVNIEQIVLNLVINARDAMPDGGTITVRTRNVAAPEGHGEEVLENGRAELVCLSIEDTGVGMNEQTIERVFDPFFTTKAMGKGTGLGLAVVYGIVDQHHGRIEVQSTPGQGTIVKVYLPASPGEPVGEIEDVISAKDHRGRGERILVVEDERGVLDLAAALLRESGYSVFEARSAEEAMAIFSREQGDFDLVFSDVVLPGRSGVELAEDVLSTNSEVGIVLCSGYADEKSQWPIIREKGIKFLPKPYSLQEILRAVSETISAGAQ